MQPRQAGGSRGAPPAAGGNPYGGGQRYGPGYDGQATQQALGHPPPHAGSYRGGGYGGGVVEAGAPGPGGPPPMSGPWGGHGMHAPVGSGQRFCAVKLRGLPFGVSEMEVGMFLGLDPIDVLLVQRNGRPTGEAVAVLSHPAELDMALRRNKAYLGTRYIEVFESRKIDYYRAIADTISTSGGHEHRRGRDGRDRSRSPHRRSKPDKGGPEPGTTRIVKLRGLPFSAGVDRVIEFFSDPELGLPEMPTEDKVLIATGPDKRPSGMAFVEFDSLETAKLALKKHKQMMGTRYIEVFPASEDDRARYLPIN